MGIVFRKNIEHELTESQKHNLKKFFRFLKNENAFARFLYCTHHVSESNRYSTKGFFTSLENKYDLVNLVPFPWSSIENSCNNANFWAKLHYKWLKKG